MKDILNGAEKDLQLMIVFAKITKRLITLYI